MSDVVAKPPIMNGLALEIALFRITQNLCCEQQFKLVYYCRLFAVQCSELCLEEQFDELSSLNTRALLSELYTLWTLRKLSVESLWRIVLILVVLERRLDNHDHLEPLIDQVLKQSSLSFPRIIPEEAMTYFRYCLFGFCLRQLCSWNKECACFILERFLALEIILKEILAYYNSTWKVGVSLLKGTAHNVSKLGKTFSMT